MTRIGGMTQPLPPSQGESDSYLRTTQRRRGYLDLATSEQHAFLHTQEPHAPTAGSVLLDSLHIKADTVIADHQVQFCITLVQFYLYPVCLRMSHDVGQCFLGDAEARCLDGLGQPCWQWLGVNLGCEPSTLGLAVHIPAQRRHQTEV